MPFDGVARNGLSNLPTYPPRARGSPGFVRSLIASCGWRKTHEDKCASRVVKCSRFMTIAALTTSWRRHHRSADNSLSHASNLEAIASNEGLLSTFSLKHAALRASSSPASGNWVTSQRSINSSSK